MLDLTGFWQPFALVVVTAVFAFIAAMYWNSRKKVDDEKIRIESDAAKMRDEIDDLKRQIAVLNIPVKQMNEAFQAMLIKQLTHFHTPELDILLAKIGPPMTLDEGELYRLQVLLRARERDMGSLINESERDAARMLPLVMKRVLSDQEHPITPLDLVVVAVPKDAAEKAPEPK